MTAPAIDPRRTALVVMDYQDGIIGRVEDALGMSPLEIVAGALAVARRHGITVAFVRVAFTDDEFDALPPHSPMAGSVTPERRAAMHADHPGTAVHPRLGPGPDDIVVRKRRVGSFSTTDLDQRLRARGITTLVLAGLSTSGVVLTTVREAADLDYRVVVLADACADPSPEVHDVLVERIFPRQALVTTADHLPAMLGGGPTERA